MQHKIDYPPLHQIPAGNSLVISSCTKSPALSAQERTLQQKQASIRNDPCMELARERNRATLNQAKTRRSPNTHL